MPPSINANRHTAHLKISLVCLVRCCRLAAVTLSEQKRALACAIKAARSAGRLMRQNLEAVKKINSESQHDIKLELDVRCQKLIERILSSAFPKIAILGEEGVAGDQAAARRWVIDPIDGTVNFTYGIPHACVSIALQIENAKPAGLHPDARFKTVLGAVYDPFADEIWTAIRGQPARRNGKIITVSRRRKLNQTIVSIGFAKERKTMDKMIPVLNQLLRRVRKVRIMGAAALALTYV